MFEKKAIKSAFGGFISITTLASGLFFLPGDQGAITSNFEPFNQEVSIETQKSFSNVLPEYTGISQGFHIGHPGIDITAKLGSKIYPLKEGVVVNMTNMKWDYGRSVTIDHGNGMVTLYAHMGKIFVEEGEKVTTDMPIGEVGVTGRTTGPHLHLEIIKSDNRVNPRPYLALGDK
jgi:murein DD-endopeptidase MepM/ murein hydrolase activator NlpD